MDKRTGKRMNDSGSADKYGRPMSRVGAGNSYGRTKDKYFSQFMTQGLNFTPQMIFSMWNNKNFNLANCYPPNFNNQGFGNQQPNMGGMQRMSNMSSNQQNPYLKDGRTESSDVEESRQGYMNYQNHQYQDRSGRDEPNYERNGNRGEIKSDQVQYKEDLYLPSNNKPSSIDKTSAHHSANKVQTSTMAPSNWQNTGTSYPSLAAETLQATTEKVSEGKDGSGSKNPSEATTGMPIKHQPPSIPGVQASDNTESGAKIGNDLFQSPFSKDSVVQPEGSEQYKAEVNTPANYDHYSHQQNPKYSAADPQFTWKNNGAEQYRESNDDGYQNDGYQRGGQRYAREENGSSQKYRYPYEANDHQHSMHRGGQPQNNRFPDARNGQYYQAYFGRDSNKQPNGQSMASMRDHSQSYYQAEGGRPTQQWNRYPDKYAGNSARNSNGNFNTGYDSQRASQNTYDLESVQKTHQAYHQDSHDQGQRQDTDHSWPSKENVVAREHTAGVPFSSISEQYARTLPGDVQATGYGADRYHARGEQPNYYPRPSTRDHTDQRRVYNQPRDGQAYGQQGGSQQAGFSQAGYDRSFSSQNVYR
jgi:hypothetical protein